MFDPIAPRGEIGELTAVRETAIVLTFLRHEHDHEGTVSYESGASTADLVAGLARIREDDAVE